MTTADERNGHFCYGMTGRSVATSGMRDYRKLKVFPGAHALVLYVYRDATPLLPRAEKYGLIAQMRDAARSVPANLLEGCGRRTNLDFARFTDQACGSANELLYYAILCRDLEFLPREVADELERRTLDVLRQLVALARGARQTPDPTPRHTSAPPRSTRRTLPAQRPRSKE